MGSFPILDITKRQVLISRIAACKTCAIVEPTTRAKMDSEESIMADWSIKIVPAASGGGAAFQPDLQGYKPGQALPAQQDDLVTWNNTTNEAHQPWQTDSNYEPLSDAWVAQ